MTVVFHPGPERAVLACACGTVLDATDMHRIRPPEADSATAIYRIGCAPCAGLATRVAPIRQWRTRRWAE